jgi:transcriptional regulator with XRE-family HTH domain
MLYNMSNFTQTVAARVRAAMAAQRKTVVDLSDATGMALSTLSRRLSGRSAWRTDEIAAVADFLGITPGSIVGDSFAVERVA